MSLVQQAQQLVSKHLKNGDIAVDATVGNGHDTVFLAQCVGDSGKVYGFDIQQAALNQCYQRLQQHQLTQRVSLIHAGHETMAIVLPDEVCDSAVSTVMFNLGYLPGGDKTRTTQTSTTLSALQTATQILKPGGIISIIAYTGHPGGQQECELVKAWGNTLPSDMYSVTATLSQHSKPSAPELFIINKI